MAVRRPRREQVLLELPVMVIVVPRVRVAGGPPVLQQDDLRRGLGQDVAGPARGSEQSALVLVAEQVGRVEQRALVADGQLEPVTGHLQVRLEPVRPPLARVQLPEEGHAQRSLVGEVFALLALLQQRIAVRLHRAEPLAQRDAEQGCQLGHEHAVRIVRPGYDGDVQPVQRGVEPAELRQAVVQPAHQEVQLEQLGLRAVEPAGDSGAKILFVR
ncbi:hypothetical protein PM3016_794 [Paenibacillus mucilaginosus 3016]|uniref:Uncharacterized protein n=1 Tax=Paenibacillus mucilaginosus 3016 TaxID=1116391 RepID=H6N900_9BACL|nr:hypothetical protein [Paenibacillus mucilaginosus]AFC27746.1 hypothetical protein PM3016_794 [Paenibacillus mucilaginosus 3016]